ncbi:hypothetical protein E2C01_034246 [Portunus trituberculatus]|uniref:Uncharacterized protein n=1 Tax=Portunus trituberculatus TaxID=210409 RepID=A0A5B7F019_PORTR|nr:hypothetical protein [Portunus trituberculatus]
MNMETRHGTEGIIESYMNKQTHQILRTTGKYRFFFILQTFSSHHNYLINLTYLMSAIGIYKLNRYSLKHYILLYHLKVTH